ncbi:MAG: hypothetical protein ACJ761_03195 [Chloroflexota bacterium]
MSGRHPFDRSELPLDEPADELVASLLVGRQMQVAAERTSPAADPGLVDRVMAAIETEPQSAPVIALASAARDGRSDRVLSALVDLWRVAFSGGRPAWVRAQAVVAVLVATMLVGSLGGIAVAGASGLLHRAGPPDVPGPVPVSTPRPSETAPDRGFPGFTIEPAASTIPNPTPTASPRSTVRPSVHRIPRPTETPERPATPRPTADRTAEPDGDGDDHSGPGGGGGTLEPDGGSSGSDSGHSDSTATPSPEPDPTATPGGGY